MLNISEIPITKVADQFGTPIYIYSEKIIKNRLDILREHFKDFDLFYSFKANPNPHVCKFIKSQGCFADVASTGEVDLAVECGFKKSEIIYSSPGKTQEQIEKALGNCIIVADSINELKLINEICKNQKIIEDIAIRINPEYSINSTDALEIMSGFPSKFGIDQEALIHNLYLINSLSNIRIKGIQVYMGSQIIDYEIIYNNFLNIFKIATSCMKVLGFELEFIDFGGGFGIQYQEYDKDLDIKKAGEMVQKLKQLDEFKDAARLRLIIESGRFICGPSGIYVSKVVDIKVSRGKKYVILDGGMNTFFRPIFIKDNSYPIKVVNKINNIDKEKVTLAGVMCTPIDVFQEDVILPLIDKGDLIAFLNAGAYGHTMSLTKFISHAEAKEVYIASGNNEFKTEVV